MKPRGVSILDLGPKALAQAREQLVGQAKVEKPAKYRNKPTPFTSTQGFSLVAASKAEARDYAMLDFMLKGKVALRWVPQVSFILPGNLRYRCDALVWWADGAVTVRDCKGVMTKAFRDRERLMKSTYNIDIEIVK